MALGALAAMSGRYGRRQATIERQYQARERVAAGEMGTAAADDADRREFATPGETLVPLWPLAVLLVAVALVAIAMLYRNQQSRVHQRSVSPP